MSTEVANTILEQLGGNKFIAMTGAKYFGAGENSLHFRVGRNAGKINCVRVTLNGLDLYGVEYMRLWGSKVTMVATSENLYADMLQADFTEKTGMYTSLGAMAG